MLNKIWDESGAQATLLPGLSVTTNRHTFTSRRTKAGSLDDSISAPGVEWKVGNPTKGC